MEEPTTAERNDFKVIDINGKDSLEKIEADLEKTFTKLTFV